MYYYYDMSITETTTVTTKGQVTIPEPLRRKYGLLPGTRVAWIERDGAVLAIPMARLADLAGSLKSEGDEPSLADMLIEQRGRERDRENG